MGYRRVVRSLLAASNSSDRISRSYQKLLEKQKQLEDKIAEIEQNEQLVETFNNYIERLQNIHKDFIKPYDWVKIKNNKPPKKPINLRKNENAALAILNEYTPSFIDKIFKKADKKIENFKANIEAAKTDDTNEYNEALKVYNEEFEAYKETVNIATGILANDVNSYKMAINMLEPLSDLKELGVSTEYPEITLTKVKALIYNNNDNIIPKKQYSLLKSGKLSTKDMAISKQNEIYQDYICSIALKLARDLFSLLPINEVILNVKNHMINTSTGQKEYQTILSVKFVRETINSLNFDLIDPSDCMKNFIHNMNYKKTQGMLPVEEIQEN